MRLKLYFVLMAISLQCFCSMETIFAQMLERKPDYKLDTMKKQWSIRESFEKYYLDNGTYPTEVQGLDALRLKPTIAPIPVNYHYSYSDLYVIPRDAWGNSMRLNVYICDNTTLPTTCPNKAILDANSVNMYNLYTEQKMVLMSAGQDGIFGTADDMESANSSTIPAIKIYKNNKKRLTQLMQMSQAYLKTNPSSSLLGDLLAVSSNPPAYASGGCNVSAARQSASSTYAKAIAGDYFSKDTYNRPFLFHAKTGMFYALGPDNADNTCDKNAVNDGFDIPYSTSNTINSGFILPATTNLTASTASSTSINVSWNAVSGASSYTIYQSTDGTIFVQSTTTAGTNAAITGLTCGTKYYFQNRPTNTFSNSASSQSSIANAITSIDAPTSLMATASGTTVNLSWSNSCSTVSNYTIQRSLDQSNWTTMSSTLTATSYSDTGLGSGTYYYRVLASNALISSAYSSVASAGVIALSAPVLSGFLQNSNTQIQLTWTVGMGASSYLIQRKQSGVTDWGDYVAQGGTSYLDSPLTGTWCYRVMSVDSFDKKSSSSNELCYTTMTPEGPILALYLNLGAITLNWSNVNSAVSYRLLRSVSSGSYSQFYNSNNTSYNDTSTGQKQCYIVYALFFNDISSSPSNQVCSYYINLKVTLSSALVYDLSWTTEIQSSYFNVYMDDAFVIKANQLSYEGTQFVQGEHCFQIFQFDDSGKIQIALSNRICQYMEGLGIPILPTCWEGPGGWCNMTHCWSKSGCTIDGDNCQPTGCWNETGWHWCTEIINGVCTITTKSKL